MNLKYADLEISLQLEPWKWNSTDPTEPAEPSRWRYLVKRREDVLEQGRAWTYMDALKAAEEAVVRHGQAEVSAA